MKLAATASALNSDKDDSKYFFFSLSFESTLKCFEVMKKFDFFFLYCTMKMYCKNRVCKIKTSLIPKPCIKC